MLQVPGPRIITFRGRPFPRQAGHTTLDDLTCPDGHRLKLKGMVIREDGALRCTSRTTQPAKDDWQGECGALMWLLTIPAAGRKLRFWAADVAYEELELWQRESASVDEILMYLGAWLVRPASATSARGRKSL